MNAVGISKPNGAKVLLTKDGNTDDIINAVLDVVGDVRAQTRDFSRQFSRDKEGLHRLWSWVKKNIQYKEDPLGVQWVREPARLYSDRVGDCKSFTVFIVSVLENLGVDYYIRFSNTERKGSKIVNHVYPVAILPNGKEVIVDAVYNFFNAEAPWYYIKDYSMSEIYRLSGIGATEVAATEAYLAELNALGDSISDDVLQDDITNMTAGEFARWQQSQKLTAQADTATDSAQEQRFRAAVQAVQSGSIAGIGALPGSDAKKINDFLATTSTMTGKAFSAPVLALPSGVTGGIGKGVLKVLADAVLKVWKKVLNWIFKTAMPIAGPFFLYSFLKKQIGKKTEAKRQKQAKLVQWIQTTGQFDSPGAVMESIKTAIIKKTGKTPQALLNESVKGGGIAGIGFAPALIGAALKIVFEIIEKVAKLFKKNKPAVDADAAPDTNELAYEYQETLAANQAIITTPSTAKPSATDSGGNNNTMLIVVGVAAAGAIYLATQ
jgi:hypothetical protein